MTIASTACRGVLAAALLAGPAAAQAQAVFCAGTVAQLQAALADIATQFAASSQTIDLRIRSGYYAIPAPPSGLSANLRLESTLDGASYRVSGGWNSNCSVQSPAPAQATTLDAQGLGGVFHVMALRSQDNTPQAALPTIRFDNLRIRNGIRTAPEALAGGVAVINHTRPQWPTNTPVPYWRLSVERVMFEDCQAALDASSAFDLTVRNSVFVDNYGRFPAINATFAKDRAYLTNNTFRRNVMMPVVVPGSVADGAEVYISSDPEAPGAKYLTNNLFAETVLGNADSYQLAADSATYVNRNRIIASQVGGVDGTLPILVANTSVVPGFAGSGNHALSTSSPLRDAGGDLAPGGVGDLDHAGTQRILGSAVDIGAFELPPVDALFAHSFE